MGQAKATMCRPATVPGKRSWILKRWVHSGHMENPAFDKPSTRAITATGKAAWFALMKA